MALGRTWSEAAVGPLAAALSADPRAAVREAAAVALGQTWCDTAIAPLTDAMAGDVSARVRESAARAVRLIAGDRAA